MNSDEYTKSVITRSGLIILDTSTLMKKRFQFFLENNKDWLVLNNKRFFVHRAVYTEIARHLRSGDPELVEAAMRAIKLMVENSDVFLVDSAELSDEEVERTFADNILLAELTRNMSDCSQLFIVNDRNLGNDAFNLNRLQSCRGHRIYVCFINPFGELQCSDCVQLANADKRADAEDKGGSIQKEACVDTVKTDVSSVAETEMTKVEPVPPQESWKFDLKSGAITGLSLAALFAVFKGGSAIIRSIRSR